MRILKLITVVVVLGLSPLLALDPSCPNREYKRYVKQEPDGNRVCKLQGNKLILCSSMDGAIKEEIKCEKGKAFNKVISMFDENPKFQRYRLYDGCCK